jgi:hypothetical protein
MSCIKRLSIVIGLPLLVLISSSQFAQNVRLLRQLFQEGSIVAYSGGPDDKSSTYSMFSSSSRTFDMEDFRTNVEEQPSHRFLIIQYSGIMVRSFSSELNNTLPNQGELLEYYESLLTLTSKANQAYAIKWGLDYILFRGIAFLGKHYNESCGIEMKQFVKNGLRIQEKSELLPSIFDEPTNSGGMHAPGSACPYNFSQSRATYNKIVILQLLLHEETFRDKYDRVLIMDSDAMLYDFQRNIADYYVPEPDTEKIMTEAEFRNRSDYVLVAHKTNKSDSNNTGSINIGVTLWNLRHPVTPFVVQKWQMRSIARMKRDNKSDDDQSPLQFILKEDIPIDRRERVVLGVSDEFGYGRGKFIKHFIRPNFSNWITQNTPFKSDKELNRERIMKIQNALDEVCKNHKPICDF